LLLLKNRKLGEMNKFTKQMKEWGEKFGKEHTDRNALSLQEMELIYKEHYRLIVINTSISQKNLGE